MGDTIMVRSFVPLPRVEKITLLRPDTAFVTGQVSPLRRQEDLRGAVVLRAHSCSA